VPIIGQIKLNNDPFPQKAGRNFNIVWSTLCPLSTQNEDPYCLLFHHEHLAPIYNSRGRERPHSHHAFSTIPCMQHWLKSRGIAAFKTMAVARSLDKEDLPSTTADITFHLLRQSSTSCHVNPDRERLDAGPGGRRETTSTFYSEVNTKLNILDPHFINTATRNFSIFIALQICSVHKFRPLFPNLSKF